MSSNYLEHLIRGMEKGVEEDGAVEGCNVELDLPNRVSSHRRPP